MICRIRIGSKRFLTSLYTLAHIERETKPRVHQALYCSRAGIESLRNRFSSSCAHIREGSSIRCTSITRQDLYHELIIFSFGSDSCAPLVLTFDFYFCMITVPRRQQIFSPHRFSREHGLYSHFNKDKKRIRDFNRSSACAFYKKQRELSNYLQNLLSLERLINREMHFKYRCTHTHSSRRIFAMPMDSQGEKGVSAILYPNK
ncbi:unnamed protein product [Trichogramma brassicae]|uniref:Uncharacterized protein n=1 Tax=Trichogramma brassicae TaxID=86971 RepID=A0A6H5I0K8_9HYME|nr:unnamed protein product [Trichogramma brassicae]